MSQNHDEFSLPDIAAIFDQYEVEDKEHPVYTAFTENNDTNDDNEFSEEEYTEKASDENAPYSPFKGSNNQSEGRARERRVRRSTGRTDPENNALEGSDSGGEHGADVVNKKPTRKSANRPKSGRAKVSRNPVEEDSETEDTRHVDKRTGVEYELLPGSSPEAVKAFKANGGAGLSLEEMFAYTSVADGFDGLDLASDAKRFLPHLQVPISEKEREEALRKIAKSNKKDNK